MASKRLARRRQEAAPAQNNPPSPVLSAEQAAKLDRLAEDFLHDLGLSPQSVNGLTEKQFGLKLGLMFSGSELGRLTFDLDEQDVEWLKAQPGRAMQTDSVSGEPKLYLFPQQQEDTERILAEWAVSYTHLDVYKRQEYGPGQTACGILPSQGRFRPSGLCR